VQLSEVCREWWMNQFTVTDVRFDKIQLEKLRPRETNKLNTRIR